MKLIFERNSPLNTTLVDEATGEVVYEIETSGLLSRATIIWIPTRNRQGDIVPNNYTEIAKIEWNRWSSDIVVIHGRTLLRREFLPEAGILGRDYSILVEGTEYRWSTGFRGMPKLSKKHGDKELIARLHEAHHIFDRRKAFLEVTSAGLAMLDLIVVSLVYVETKRRQRRSASNGAGAGGIMPGGGGANFGGGGGGNFGGAAGC